MTLLLVAGLCTVSVHSQGMDDISAEDVVEGEEDDVEATVESDDSTGSDVPSDLTSTEGETEEEVPTMKPSQDAETYLLFIQPKTLEFPAGKMVRFIVGFKNNGDKEFVVETMDAAFRYPQDYSYYIQNFTVYQYQQTVEAKHDATFEYAFTPSDSFSARPFGLTINLNYRDADGNNFQDAVFNSTINVTEPDEGFDTETFFLYVFLAAVVLLLFVGLHQLFNTYGKKRLISRRFPTVELGTQNNKGDVDYQWLPDTLLTDINRSPKASKTPPRQRKTRNHADVN